MVALDNTRLTGITSTNLLKMDLSVPDYYEMPCGNRLTEPCTFFSKCTHILNVIIFLWS